MIKRESILKLDEGESRFEKANIVNVTICQAQLPLKKKLIEKTKKAGDMLRYSSIQQLRQV